MPGLTTINSSNRTSWHGPNGAAQGDYGVSSDDGIIKITSNAPKDAGAANWGRSLWQNIALKSVTAKYCIVKYRIPTAAVPEGKTTIGSVKFVLNTEYNVTLDVSDEWQTLVITMSETDPVSCAGTTPEISWVYSTTHQNADETWAYDLGWLEIEYITFVNELPAAE